MDEVLGNKSAQVVVVISTKPGCFIAGADVKLVHVVRVGPRITPQPQFPPPPSPRKLENLYSLILTYGAEAVPQKHFRLR